MVDQQRDQELRMAAALRVCVLAESWSHKRSLGQLQEGKPNTPSSQRSASGHANVLSMVSSLGFHPELQPRLLCGSLIGVSFVKRQGKLCRQRDPHTEAKVLWTRVVQSCLAISGQRNPKRKDVLELFRSVNAEPGP